MQEFVANPLGDKVARRSQDDTLIRNLGVQHPDPCVELLRIKAALEMGEAMAPEIVHEQAVGFRK